MSAITCEVSELGTFFDANEKQLSPVLIDLWDGRDSFDRWLSSQESTHIENPWLNLIAATTPSWLRESFTDSMIGGGLVSRVIFVYADKKRHLIPYINELVDSEAHLDLERKLVHDLGEISKLQGAFTLTRHAIAIGSHWYYEHWEHPPDHMTSERFQGYRARKQTHLHKLAMILSASESDSMIITETHLHTALGLLEGVEHDMHYVFDSIGGSNATQQMQTLLAILRVNRKMTKTEAWRQCMGVMSLKEFSEALDGLVQGTRAKIINTAGSYLIHYIELNPEITDLEEEREKRQQ